jgi:hypothetical protein
MGFMGEAKKEVAAHSFHSQDRTAGPGRRLHSKKEENKAGGQTSTPYVSLNFSNNPLMTNSNYTTVPGVNTRDFLKFQ